MDESQAGPQQKDSDGDPGTRPERAVRVWTRYATSLFFFAAGLNHFVNPEWYLLNQMPDWIPFPVLALYVTGAAEMLGGMGLLPEVTRKWAGWGLVALLVAIFPGNIHMASESLNSSGFSGETIGLFLRLPLQAVFIVVVLWVSQNRPAGPR